VAAYPFHLVACEDDDETRVTAAEQNVPIGVMDEVFGTAYAAPVAVTPNI
jgi:hypothetical protein